MIRFLVAAALLAGTIAYVRSHAPVDLAVGQGALRACPVTFDAWNGSDLTFDDAVQEELDADDILIRKYERDGRSVWLCIVYHQNRRYGAHDPKLCYRSQGYVVEREGRSRIEDGSATGLGVNRFVADRRSDRRLVYYWWTTEGLTTADAEAFRSRLALAGALENRSWGAFVRVEALADAYGDSAAWADLDDFAARVARALPGVFEQAASRAAEQGP